MRESGIAGLWDGYTLRMTWQDSCDMHPRMMQLFELTGVLQKNLQQLRAACAIVKWWYAVMG